MSRHRKNTHHNHTAIGIQRLPPLEFNLEQIRIVKKGMSLFAESLQRSQPTAPNMTLARFSYVTVLNKLKRIVAADEVVTFDYNELVVISGCLDMIMIDASFLYRPLEFDIAMQLNEKIKDQIATAPRIRKPHR